MTIQNLKKKITRNAIARPGWKPDTPDARDKKWKATMLVGQLPPAIDLTNRAKWPKPYDQQSLGSCTAHAIAAAIQYEQIKEGMRMSMPSRLYIYYMERLREGTIGEDAGAQIRTGMKVMLKDGSCVETSWPYLIDRFTEEPSARATKNALTRKMIGYQRVQISLNKIKMALAEDYPIVGGFCVYTKYFSPDATRTGYIPLPKKNEGLQGGHAILIVGYDDVRRVFKFRNSYGPGWGDNGYGYLPYEYITDPRNLCDDFWIFKPVEAKK